MPAAITGTPTNVASIGGPASDGVYHVSVTVTDENGATFTTIVDYTISNPGTTATNNTNSVTEDTLLIATGNAITDDNADSGASSNAKARSGREGLGCACSCIIICLQRFRNEGAGRMPDS